MRLLRLNKNKMVNRCDDIRHDSRARDSHLIFSAPDNISNNPETLQISKLLQFLLNYFISFDTKEEKKNRGNKGILEKI